jgi:ABC-type nickel/cobalt efflux system permease component RcnA
MFGLTTSQSIASVLILVFIIFYFAANSGIQQNAFIYLLATTIIVLIVGTYFIYDLDCLFMNDKAFDYEPQY